MTHVRPFAALVISLTTACLIQSAQAQSFGPGAPPQRWMRAAPTQTQSFGPPIQTHAGDVFATQPAATPQTLEPYTPPAPQQAAAPQTSTPYFVAAPPAAAPTQPAARADTDLCALVAARPGWRAALQSAQARWSASPAMVLALIRTQGGLNTAPAKGYVFAARDTALWHLRDTRAPSLDLRRFGDAAHFTAWYFHKTRRVNSTPMEDLRGHYLNYLIGHGAFKRQEWRGRNELLEKAAAFERRAQSYAQALAQCGL